MIGFGASAGGGELDRFLAVSLAVVLSNAALHKLSIVFVQRSSRWDNRVVHYPRLLPWAPTLYACFGAMDALAVILLLAIPAKGAILAAGLLSIYTAVGLLTMRPGQSCNCFTPTLLKVLEARTRVSLVARNGVFTAACCLLVLGVA